MKPDLIYFQKHIKEAPFQIGVDEGYWGIYNNDLETTWPFIVIWVKARDMENLPDRYYFRFDLSGYPTIAPTACPWSVEGNTPLPPNDWPRGGRKTSSIFNPNWKSSALYIPCDRAAQPGHDIWKQRHPELWWYNTDDITKYLSLLYRTLQSKDYGI